MSTIINPSVLDVAKKIGITENDIRIQLENLENSNKKFNIEDYKEPTDFKAVILKLVKSLKVSERLALLDIMHLTLHNRKLCASELGDSTIVNVDEINEKFILTTESEARYVNAHPVVGIQIAVAEAARNIACSGGEPHSITVIDHLHNSNYDQNWRLIAQLDGAITASEKLNVPIVSRDISFTTHLIDNNPIIGMVGTIADKQHITSYDFKGKSDLVFMIGNCMEDISSSKYLQIWHGVENSPAPYFNIDEEIALQGLIQRLTQQQLIKTAHNITSGGLFFALLESTLPKGVGFDILTDAEIRKDAYLFGESQGRILITVPEHLEDNFIDFMENTDVPYTLLGHVTRGEIRIDDESYGYTSELSKI